MATKQTESVIVGRNGGRGSGRSYHTDEDCPNLPDKPISKAMEFVEQMKLTECKFCAGEVTHSWSGEKLSAKIRREYGSGGG